MRKLQANEVECRVATVKPTGISLLLYKTARVDRAILDEEFGSMSWQNDFKVIDGKMYGGIGIYSNDLGEWLWRWDCGTESNTEAEKGQASDCFKRAGFKWGIGIELYTAPFIWIKGDGNVLKYEKFEVVDIGYSTIGEINKLKIINSKSKEVVYELGKQTKKLTNEETCNLSKEDISTQVQSLRKNNIEGIKDLLNRAKTKQEAFDIYQKFSKEINAYPELLELVAKRKREL